VNFAYGRNDGETVDISSLGAFCQSLQARNLLLASNLLHGSIGHASLELDFLLRARRTGLVPGGRTCLLVMPEEPFAQAFAEHFSDLLRPFIVSTQVWLWAREIVCALPEFAFDIGASHISTFRPLGDPDHRWIIWSDRLQFMTSTALTLAKITRHAALRAATSDWYPFRRELKPSTELARFLDAVGDRPLAFVHIKDATVNASPEPTDPRTYFPTLAHICDLGWQPVFVGRETMPDGFRAFGVADYAGSGIASISNDLVLFSRGRVALTGGSGIAHAFEIIDLPLVYTNGWHIYMQCSARRCVVVPATMRARARGRHVSILEQIRMIKNFPTGAFFVFPHQDFVPEQATAEHIHSAFEEALTLGGPGIEPPEPSSLQERFKRLDPGSAFAAGKARVGSMWATDFESRFGDQS